MELGTVEAPSREAASASLVRRGLFPVSVALDTTHEDARRTLPLEDLALGLRVLADLLAAGLSIGRALAAFGELAPERWRAAMPAVERSVREGRSLTSALAGAPVAIPELVLGMIRAGESSGQLAQAIRRAADMMEAERVARAAIRSALAYPALLAVASLASVALLVGVVLPRFAAILGDLGQALPRSTALVLQASSVARAGALPLLVGVMAGVVLWRAWTRTDAGRRAWHALLLATPVIGTVRRASGASHLAQALASALESGVPIPAAMALAARAGADAALELRMLDAREAVLQGERLSRALVRHDAATPTLVQLVRAGEETGQLGVMLARGAAIERERAERLVRGAVRFLEPGLILLFGGIVALVAAALLQAVYSVRPGV